MTLQDKQPADQGVTYRTLGYGLVQATVKLPDGREVTGTGLTRGEASWRARRKGETDGAR